MTMTYRVRRWRPRVRGCLIWRAKRSGGGITANLFTERRYFRSSWSGIVPRRRKGSDIFARRLPQGCLWAGTTRGFQSPVTFAALATAETNTNEHAWQQV